MINPDKITNFYQTIQELENFSIFWVAVAGKTAHVTAPRIDRFLKEIQEITGIPTPYKSIATYCKPEGYEKLIPLLKKHGIGCMSAKARTIHSLATSGLDLKTCTYEDLREIWGMGQKTARCFLIHSRKDCEEAGLDTHLMTHLIEEYSHILKQFGIDPSTLPKGTPPKKLYDKLTPVVVHIFKSEGMTAAEWDLGGWKKRRRVVKNMVS